MPRQRIDFIGNKGLNTDLMPSSLSSDIWNTLDDVVSVNGALKSVYGEDKIWDLDIKPVYHNTYKDTSGSWYIVISDGINTCLVKASNGVSIDITPETPPAHAGRVSIVSLNGVLIVNYAKAGPFYYSPGNGLLPLPGWDSGWLCQDMIAFRYFLFALNMTEDGNKYPHKLRWSNSAQEGDIPTLWVAAADNDAGDDIIGETMGHIIGGLIIRDYLYVVKEDALYAVSFIGGTYIMKADRLHGASGTQLIKGFTDINGSVVTCDLKDVRIFDGQVSKSLVDNRVRKALSSIVENDKKGYTSLFRHNNSGLLIISGPQENSARLDRSLVYDYIADVWWSKSLSNSYGFDSVPLTDDDTPISEIIVYESNDDDDEWWISALSSVSANSDLTEKTCYAVKLGIPFEQSSGIAMVNEAWLDIEGDIDVSVTFGSQEAPTGAVTWGDTQVWTPGTTQHLTPRVSGRYIAISLMSNDAGSWSVSGITYNWERVGER